jgi:hypothetical protein
MIEVNIWRDFQEIDCVFDASRELYQFLFDDEKWRRMVLLIEIWSLDSIFEKLSVRRPKARFECINEPE